MDFEGVIIEESLEDAAVLSRVTILETRVSRVTERHATPWLSRWTLHTVSVPEAEAAEVARTLSGVLRGGPPGAWYADFKDDSHHYVVFRDRVFFIDRGSGEEYGAAEEYGRGLGIPEHQIDFSALIVE